MTYTLAIHPTCPASRELVLSLRDRGLLGRLRVLLLDEHVPLNPPVFPWSVPLLIDGEGDPIAMDPLSPDEVESYLNGDTYEVGEDFELIEKSILHSAYASAIALVHHSIKPLLQESFLYPALRLKTRGLRLADALKEIERLAGDFYEEVKERIARALSIAVVRFYYYSGVRNWERIASLTREDIAATVLSMASIGRVGLPVSPVEPDMTGFMTGFIKRSAKGLTRKIEREYRETVMDDTYKMIVKELSENP